MKKIDLHLHSNLSDGILTPEQLVKMSKDKNCHTISITDHEIANDYSHLEEKYNISIVSGIEFNTEVRNLHILGYGIKNIDNINEYMDKIRLLNEQKCFEIIKKLEKDNFDITIDKVLKFLETEKVNNLIIDKRKIVKYLIYKKYATGVLEAYNNLLGVNQKYYVPIYKLTPEEVINLINKEEGISVLAHPSTLKLSSADLIKEVEELQRIGLSGIEIVNSKNSKQETKEYKEIASKLDLITTGGSDFHNPQKDKMGIFIEEKRYNKFAKKLQLKR